MLGMRCEEFLAKQIELWMHMKCMTFCEKLNFVNNY